eukprot:tig00000093_g3627.t1
MITPSLQEAARIRDRCIVACQELDLLAGIPTKTRISDDALSYPRSDYESEPFVAAIRRGELQLPSAAHASAAAREVLHDFRAVRMFLASFGVIPPDCDRAAQPDAESEIAIKNELESGGEEEEEARQDVIENPESTSEEDEEEDDSESASEGSEEKEEEEEAPSSKHKVMQIWRSL